MNTREKIRDKALEMFNERGIEYVGMRELADVLGMRVSNITYYFPTKDDLVYDISQQLSSANAGIIVTAEGLTLKGFLEMLQQVFHNQERFRCLFLSFVHLMQQNKRIAEAYKKTQATRHRTMEANLDSLVAGGYLAVADAAEKEFLVTTLALVSRFWISESVISFRGKDANAQRRNALQLIGRLLMPYATAKGRRQVQAFLEALE